MTRMGAADLFCGIAGCSLALDRRVCETRVFCDICPFARSVVKERMREGALNPCAHVHDDVRTLTWRPEFGFIHLVCAGSPCQDLSRCGRQAGVEGARTSLFREALRFADSCNFGQGAEWLFWENVSDLCNLGLDVFLRETREHGYTECRWDVLGCGPHLGAPHQRVRFFCLAKRAPPAQRTHVDWLQPVRLETVEQVREEARSSGGWDGTYPAEIPRLTTASACPAHSQRNQAVGNSMSPYAARAAFSWLVGGGLGAGGTTMEAAWEASRDLFENQLRPPRTRITTARAGCVTADGRILLRPPLKPLARVYAPIILRPPTDVEQPRVCNRRHLPCPIVTRPIRVEHWTTPRRGNWSVPGARTPLTTRTWRDLGAQIAFEEHTERLSTGELERVNPAWSEWLLGFPPGWGHVRRAKRGRPRKPRRVAHNRKPVVRRCAATGLAIEVYESQSAAGRALGARSASGISRCTNDHRSLACGSTWARAD